MRATLKISFMSPLICACVSTALAGNDLHENKDCKSGKISITLLRPTVQLSAASPQPSVDFIVNRKNKSVRCDFWVGFEKGFSPSYDRFLTNGSLKLDYDIFKTPGSAPVNLKSYPQAAGQNEVYTGVFLKDSDKTGITFTTYPKVFSPFPGPFNIKQPGTYFDVVDIALFADAFPPKGSPQKIASATQRYNYVVPEIAIVSLLDPGVPYTDPPISLKTLDFGELVTGKTKNVDMVLLYNKGYKVTFKSDYGSRLKHAKKSVFVPYTLKVAGSTIALPSGSNVTVSSGSGMSPSAPLGKRVQISAVIGSVKAKWAGQYSDCISIVMSSP